MKALDGCRRIKLKDIAHSIDAGGTPRRDVKEYWNGGLINWLKISDLKSTYISDSEEKITEKGLENSSAKIFPEGTVLFSIFATLGATGILEKPSTTNQAIAGIAPNKELIDTKYLYYSLRAERNSITAKKTHATQDNINLTILRNHEILLPPLEIQKDIVSNLEKIEKLKDWRKEAEKLTDEYLNSVFLNMFGNPVSSKRFGQERISELTSLVSYGFTKPMPHVEKGIPIITSKNVGTCHIDFHNVDYTDEKSYGELSKKDCPMYGDILYTKDGRIGEAALVRTANEFCISQAVAILRPLKGKINPFFFENLLNTKEFRRVVYGMAYGVALKHVSISKLKQINIISPPIELQDRFADIITQIEKVKEYQHQSKQDVDCLFNVSMQRAFRGESTC